MIRICLQITILRILIPSSLLVFAYGCGTTGSYRGTSLSTPTAATPLHNGPFFRTNWDDPLAKSLSTTQKQPKSDHRNLRQQILHHADQIESSPDSKFDFGSQDIHAVLRAVLPTLPWTTNDGLQKLVVMAKKCNAYKTGNKPTKGDFVLFHNQIDINGNGSADDWLTGVGILLARSGSKLEILTRTGNHPRRVNAWPDGPMTHQYRGKTINSFVRIPQRSDPENAEYLSGQLYAGYIDVTQLGPKCAK